MAGGVDRIEDLQRHENHKIYDMAVKILENYFGVDDDEEERMVEQDGQAGFACNEHDQELAANNELEKAEQHKAELEKLLQVVRGAGQDGYRRHGPASQACPPSRSRIPCAR